ncbi:DUF3871 family protein, partial [Bacteroidota bacterium]
MELMQYEMIKPKIEEPRVSSSDGFINANTKPIDLTDLKHKSIIPVFAKDNETTISHSQFIDCLQETAYQFFSGEQILTPAIRVSHPVKGRIPEAMEKPVHLLTENEKTIYYERMAFIIEIPSITDNVAGNDLSLCMGGVKAYNHENLYGKKSEERFKVFVGFQNKVCINLCIWTDGFKSDIRVRSQHELSSDIFRLLSQFDIRNQMSQMKELPEFALSENQFAQLVGRMRMYPFLPTDMKQNIPAIELGDSQINTVVKDYYQDESFCRDEVGNINLWKLYNLFTGANKSSYIDTFSDRLVSIQGFIQSLQKAFEPSNSNWY